MYGSDTRNIDCTFVYLDDILIVTRGSNDLHSQKVTEVTKILDEANWQLKINNSNIACKKVERLGYELSGSGISRENDKVQGISEKLRPTNLKKLRSFLGPVNQF